jgi:C-terminal processing protease CtpA/Prc
MRKTGMILIVALVLLVGLPLMAGEGHKKCTASTQECLDKIAQKYKGHGWVGIEGDKKEKNHFTIKKVIPGSPAEAAGLKAGDIVYAMNGVKFGDDNKDKLKQIKKGLAPGEILTYSVKRNGKSKDVAIKLGEVPDEVLAQWVGEHMLQHASVKVASK